MGRPVEDSLNISPPKTLIERTMFIQPRKLNTVRLMHDPLDTRVSRWFDISAGMPLLTHGNQVKTLIRGKETFQHMVEAIRSANPKVPNTFVYLLGWFMTDGLPLLPGDSNTTPLHLFADAAKLGVEIRAMLWANHKGLFAPHTIPSVEFIKALPKGFAICDNKVKSRVLSNEIRNALPSLMQTPAWFVMKFSPSLPLNLLLNVPVKTGSHHQKILIVNNSEGLVAFCGGIDLVADRMDAGEGHPGAG